MADAAETLWAQDHADGTALTVRAHPGARKNAIDASRADMLKVSVTAPPDKGKANKEIAALLAKKLGCAKSKVRLMAGQTSREKRFLVEGLNAEEVTARLRQR